jgi:hypothetical protein
MKKPPPLKLAELPVILPPLTVSAPRPLKMAPPSPETPVAVFPDRVLFLTVSVLSLKHRCQII